MRALPGQREALLAGAAASRTSRPRGRGSLRWPRRWARALRHVEQARAGCAVAPRRGPVQHARAAGRVGPPRRGGLIGRRRRDHMGTMRHGSEWRHVSALPILARLRSSSSLGRAGAPETAARGRAAPFLLASRKVPGGHERSAAASGPRAAIASRAPPGMRCRARARFRSPPEKPLHLRARSCRATWTRCAVRVCGARRCAAWQPRSPPDAPRRP